MNDLIRRLRSRWVGFAKTSRGRWSMRQLRRGGTVVIAGYLAYRIGTLGWAEVWAYLPRTPWFYVLFAAIYLVQPLTQSLIYQTVWPTQLRTLFPAALVKRVYDREVLSYSGDVYLYFWGRSRLGLSVRKAFHIIKDNAIVSSIASTSIAFGLLALFVLSGTLPLPEAIAANVWTYAIGALLLAVIVGVALSKLRHSMFSLPGHVLWLLFGLNLARILTAQGLQVAQWTVVDPSVPLAIWLTFLAAQIMTGRIPFLPSKDLLFIAIGLELAGVVQVPEALIAGLLGVQSVLNKGVNFIVFITVSLWNQWHGVPSVIQPGTEDDLPGALNDKPITDSGAVTETALAPVETLQKTEA